MSMCITHDRPSMSESVRMIEEAVGQGLLFIDTANCYALDESEFGYGEALVRPFMHREGVTVATKGGMTRTGTSWGRRGDPNYLREMCEASLERLGTNSIDLYQFHAPDPNVPYEESIGELVRLRADGKIKNIGVSNVELPELMIAKQMAGICSVQNPLSVLSYTPEDREKIDTMLRYCEANGIAFIAYAPVGGHRNAHRLPTVSEDLNRLAKEEGITVYQLTLLALRALSPAIVPIPGSKSLRHILENLATAHMRLGAETLRRIGEIMEVPGAFEGK